FCPFFAIFMSSCSKQKRAALMEWRELQETFPSEQGGSYAQYSQEQLPQALPTLSTPTQGAAACPQATASARSAGSVGHPLLLANLCFGVHRPHLRPHLGPAARGYPDCGQPYGAESAPHTRSLAAGISFQLPSRLLQTTLVAVASGLP